MSSPGTRSPKLQRGIHSARPLLYLFLPLFPLIPSCSMKISHGDGSTTYLGVVNINEGDPAQTPLVHSRRYGLMLDAGTATNGFALGYDDRLLVKPPNNKITRIDYAPGNHALSYQNE